MSPLPSILLLMLLGICFGCTQHDVDTTLEPLTDSSLSDDMLGPFPDWINIRDAFGAVGDGITDDTNALQNAFNAATNDAWFFLPVGTYKISRQLLMSGNSNGNIIGEDPLTTTIVWDTSSTSCVNPNDDNDVTNCAMIQTNGVASMQFARITYDGSYMLNAIFIHHWELPINQYSGQGYHRDEVLKNAKYGMRIGWPTCYEGNCATAEWLVSRVQFRNHWGAGFQIWGWNNLDWLIRHSIFFNTSTGVTDLGGMGNFHVLESAFYHVPTAMSLGNCGYYSVRDSFFYDVGYLLYVVGNGCRSPLMFLRNTIVTSPNQVEVIRFEQDSSIQIIDNNFIHTNPNYAGPMVLAFAGYYDTMSYVAVGNTFTYSNTTASLDGVIQAAQPWVNTLEIIAFDNVLNQIEEVDIDIPVFPGFQEWSTSPIIVADNSQCEIFQGIQNCQPYISNLVAQATSLRGRRPIIYFSQTYIINDTIFVPPYSDIQFVGHDRTFENGFIGYQALNYDPSAILFWVQGPSKVTFYGIGLTQSGGVQQPAKNITAIYFENVDQPGSRVYTEQLSTTLKQHNVMVDGLDYTTFDNYAYYVSSTDVGTGTQVSGGPCLASGTGGKSYFAIFSGASGGGDGPSLYGIYNNASMLVHSIWWEQGSSWINWDSSQSGTFVYANANTGVYSPGNTISLNGFRGIFTAIGTDIGSNLYVTPGPDTNFLMLQCRFEAQTAGAFQDYYQDGKVGLFLTYFFESSPTINPDMGNMNSGNNLDWLREMLALLRSTRPSPPGPIYRTSSEVSDVRLYRPTLFAVDNGLWFQGNSASCT